MDVRRIFRNKGHEIFSIAPDEPLTVAVATMARHRIGSLAVLAEKKLISIVTERDVLCAIDLHCERFASFKVRDVMAPRLVTCQASDSIDEAMDRMFNNETGHRIRHLPVLDGETLVGVISISDIVQALLTEVRFQNKLLRNYIKNWPEE